MIYRALLIKYKKFEVADSSKISDQADQSGALEEVGSR